MSKKKQELWENIALNPSIYSKIPKNKYTDILLKYSFNVPPIEWRIKKLEETIESAKKTGLHSKTRDIQFFLGIVLSTLRISELEKVSTNLAEILDEIYKNSEEYPAKFLDFVLSKDWGKTIKIISQTTRPTEWKNLINSGYYKKSDEFGSLILKLYASEAGKKLLLEIGIDSLEEKQLFNIFDAILGKTGGLIRETYFSLRRERMSKNGEAKKYEIAKYILEKNLDDATAYSCAMLAARALHLDRNDLVNQIAPLRPNVARMLLTGFGKPFTIWSSIQIALLKNNTQKYFSKAIDKSNLHDFYKCILENHPPQKQQEKINKKVGIIITTFNPEVNLLKLAIRSILAQSHKNIALTIVDDYSRNIISNEIEKTINSIDDNRVMLIKNKGNFGQYASRNIAMKAMPDCDYFAIQDDDDISHPQRIEHQLRALEKNSRAKICMCQQVRFTKNLTYIPDKINPFEFDYSPASSFFDASVIQSVGGFANVRSRGDVEFITRIKKEFGPESIVNLSLPMYIMRCESETVSASKDRYLKTQLDVFRILMSSQQTKTYIDGQQHALSDI